MLRKISNILFYLVVLPNTRVFLPLFYGSRVTHERTALVADTYEVSICRKASLLL